MLRFLISRMVRRVASGSTILNSRGFKWAHPVLRQLDNQRRVQRAETIGSLLTSVVSLVIAVIVIIYVLQSLGVNVAPLLTSVGILGIAIGFGSQQLIRDFLAGIFITIEDQYGIGDVIQTSEVVGAVESVGLRITRVRAEDGSIWYLRNGEILRVGNRSQGNYVPPDEDDDGPAAGGANAAASDANATRTAGEDHPAGAGRGSAAQSDERPSGAAVRGESAAQSVDPPTGAAVRRESAGLRPDESAGPPRGDRTVRQAAAES
ncbi:mechanosensitive ion channel [Paenarthrobacter sp. Z7-10]|nr:mechanosensitive ion channel [Paenarthrobacter sp. Z7-10]